MLNLIMGLPVLIQERAVSYRERAALLYCPEAHSLAFALVEVPWILLVCLCCIPILYFMVRCAVPSNATPCFSLLQSHVGSLPLLLHYAVASHCFLRCFFRFRDPPPATRHPPPTAPDPQAGFTPAAGSFFFYLLVSWVFTYTLVSFGQLVAALVPTADTATAVVSGLLPIIFLFGGLLCPYGDIPVWWRWLYWLDPLSYAISALAAPQFAATGERGGKSCSGPFPDGDCPSIPVLKGAAGYVTIDLQRFVAEKYGAVYEDRWANVGFMAVFAAGFQVLHVLAARKLVHMSR